MDGASNVVPPSDLTYVIFASSMLTPMPQVYLGGIIRVSMNKSILWVVVIVAAVGGAAALYYGLQKIRPEPQGQAPAAAPSPPQAEAGAQVRYPIQTGIKPLPPLNESDAALREAVLGLLGDPSLAALLNPQELVRRVVATIDNLPRRKLALLLMPVKPAGGTFLVTGGDDGAVIGPENPARYSRYIGVVEAMDAKKLVAVYVHFYPLFQQAYRELGYPDGHFNDRLVDVIDDLLAAPEVRVAVKVVRPKVFYVFADPELEALPAGQKILLRLGAENASRIKAKLREIRGEVTRQAP